MYNIKVKVDAQIKASNNGEMKTNESANMGSVMSSFNSGRIKDLFMNNKRMEPMDKVDEGTEYSKNVEILQKMLINHDEFAAHTQRKLKALEEGNFSKKMLNPVLTEKIADVIRQLDKDSSRNVAGVPPLRIVKKKQTEAWIKKRNQDGFK